MIGPILAAAVLITITAAVLYWQVKALSRHLPPGQSEGPPGDRRRRR